MTEHLRTISQNTNSPAEKQAHTIAIGGGKGGIGKTVISASIAIALAELGMDTILIDGDLGGANLHTAMGLPLPVRTLYDFYNRNRTQLSDILIDTPIQGLRLICGALGTPGMANIKYWEKLKTIRHILRFKADFVIIDLGAGMSFNEVDLFNSAETGIVVANPEPTSIQECFNFIKVALYRKLKRELRQSPAAMQLLRNSADPTHARDNRLISDLGKEIRAADLRAGVKFFRILNKFSPKLLLNRVHDLEENIEGIALQHAAQDLLRIKIEYWGFVRYDAKIREAIRHGRPREILAPNSEHRTKIMTLVKKFLLKQHVPYQSDGLRPVVPLTDLNHPNTGSDNSGIAVSDRICSIHCPLWGNCDYQEGGMPCKMPEGEYLHKVNHNSGIAQSAD